MAIRVCNKGHITGYRNCPRCNESCNAAFFLPRRPRVAVKDSPTRQRAWRSLLAAATDAVNRSNPGMPRSERRALANAYAKGARRQRVEQQSA